MNIQTGRIAKIKLASAPESWGVKQPMQAGDPPWRRVLDEVAAAGYDGAELGPLGYMPGGDELRSALQSRGLQMPAGFVMEPLSISAQLDRILDVARRTCAILASAGAQTLILIDDLAPGRSATAGRSWDAERLPAEGWTQLVCAAHAVSEVAREHGLKVAFHPHAGTHVEFADEVERIMEDLPAGSAGLCIDTGHSVFAGIDPVSLLRRHASRLAYLHLKDLDIDVLERCRREALSFEQSVAAGVFTPLGGGSVDFAAFASALHEVGYEGWATFEQDRVTNDMEDALLDARASLEHAHGIGL